MSETRPDKTAPKAELLALYDSFAEFNDYCAFLCDALSALFCEYAEGDIDIRTVQGVKRHCGDLKERSEKLEELLNALYQQSYTGKQPN